MHNPSALRNTPPFAGFLRGEPVEMRSDIWAFACVLFEMLTGQRPFEGRTVSDILASILKTEPDWSLLPDELHPRVRFLLQRCLKKAPPLNIC